MNTGPLIAKQSKKIKAIIKKKKPYKSSLSCVLFIYYVHTWQKEPGNETWCNMPPHPNTNKELVLNSPKNILRKQKFCPIQSLSYVLE